MKNLTIKHKKKKRRLFHDGRGRLPLFLEQFVMGGESLEKGVTSRTKMKKQKEENVESVDINL